MVNKGKREGAFEAEAVRRGEGPERLDAFRSDERRSIWVDSYDGGGSFILVRLENIAFTIVSNSYAARHLIQQSSGGVRRKLVELGNNAS